MVDVNNSKTKLHNDSGGGGGGMTRRLFLSIFAAVWGMFAFGYNTGVINAPATVISDFINKTHYDRKGEPMSGNTISILFAIVVAAFAVGGMVGGFTAGWWADRFGRKKAMLINNIFGLVAAFAMGVSSLAKSYELLIIGRLIVGFCCGLFTGLVPMYLTEVAPVKFRGALGTVNQLGVVIALFLSQVLGLPQILNTEKLWPLLLALTGIPCILQLCTLPFCPESPRYLLITKNMEKDAVHGLIMLRGLSDVQEEIDEMRKEAESQSTETRFTILELLRSNSLRLPLIVSIVMHLSQQLSGINAVFYYSNDIFIGANLDATTAGYATMGVGAIMIVMTLVSIPLMDRAGRRFLHLFGLAGMFFLSIFITVGLVAKDSVDWFKYVTVVSALTYVVFFAIGPGSIPWMIVAELFSQGPRPAAMSISVLVNWFSNFIVGLSFKPLKESLLGDFCFIPFTVLLLLFWIFIFFKLPETKNKTFEEIASIFRDRTPQEKYSNMPNDSVNSSDTPDSSPDHTKL